MVQTSWVLCGQIDVKVLRQAFRVATERHDILHARLVVTDADGSISTELGELPFTLRQVGESGTDREEAAFVEEEMRQARETIDFVPEQGNLLAVELLELSGNDWLLILTASTLVADLPSLTLLAQESLASAQQMARSTDEEEKPIPYLEVMERSASSRNLTNLAATRFWLCRWWIASQAQLIDELDGLSEEEIRRMLEEGQN